MSIDPAINRSVQCTYCTKELHVGFCSAKSKFLDGSIEDYMKFYVKYPPTLSKTKPSTREESEESPEIRTKTSSSRAVPPPHKAPPTDPDTAIGPDAAVSTNLHRRRTSQRIVTPSEKAMFSNLAIKLTTRSSDVTPPAQQTIRGSLRPHGSQEADHSMDVDLPADVHPTVSSPAPSYTHPVPNSEHRGTSFCHIDVYNIVHVLF